MDWVLIILNVFLIMIFDFAAITTLTFCNIKEELKKISSMKQNHINITRQRHLVTFLKMISFFPYHLLQPLVTFVICAANNSEFRRDHLLFQLITAALHCTVPKFNWTIWEILAISISNSINSIRSINMYVKVSYTKYSKHWPHTVAHTFECVCRKC